LLKREYIAIVEPVLFLTVMTGHYRLTRLRVSLLPSTRIRRDRNPSLGLMAHCPKIKFARDRFSKLLYICGFSHDCVCRKLRPFDPVTESLNVGDDGRAAMLFIDAVGSPFRSKSRLEAENALLRQQLIVLQRRGRGRVHFTNSDRLFFVQLYRWFPSVLKAMTIIRPETLVRWDRAGFRRYWRWKPGAGQLNDGCHSGALTTALTRRKGQAGTLRDRQSVAHE
jgi:hypothetical protein